MSYVNAMQAEYDAMKAVDQLAKSKDELVGRFIQEQIADGYAYYVVVALTDMQMVKLEHVHIFDGWSVPMIESMDGIVPRKYVEENIARRDSMDEMLSRRS